VPAPAAVPPTAIATSAIVEPATEPPGQPAWQCSYANGWRVFAASSLPDALRPSAPPSPSGETPTDGAGSEPRDLVLQPMRMWLAIEPATGAVGPLDPDIPVIRVVVEDLAALGYCAATTGPDAPPQRVSVSAWSIEGAAARRLDLRVIATPDAVPDSTEGLFAPGSPMPAPQAGWPTGRYVFLVQGMATGYERWFGVDVQRWIGGGGEPSSDPPSASGTP
jgi:hypothetical protein